MSHVIGLEYLWVRIVIIQQLTYEDYRNCYLAMYLSQLLVIPPGKLFLDYSWHQIFFLSRSKIDKLM